MINKEKVIQKALDTLYDAFNNVRNSYNKDTIIVNAQLIKSTAYAYEVLTTNETKIENNSFTSNITDSSIVGLSDSNILRREETYDAM